jgi:hypothetical protein
VIINSVLVTPEPTHPPADSCTHPTLLDRLAVLAISQLGAQLCEIAKTSDGEVLLVQRTVEESLLGLEYGRQDVGLSLAISLEG